MQKPSPCSRPRHIGSSGKVEAIFDGIGGLLCSNWAESSPSTAPIGFLQSGAALIAHWQSRRRTFNTFDSPRLYGTAAHDYFLFRSPSL